MSPSGNKPSLAPQETTPAAEALDHDRWYGTVEGYVDYAHINKSDLSLMFIDIDALKATNDELGHDAGNELIDMVNGIITEGVRHGSTTAYPDRKPDVIRHTADKQSPGLEAVLPGAEVPEARSARIGGDEFGIILPDTDREGANTLAKRLRAAIDTELSLPQNRRLADVGAGISIGAATLEPGMEASDLLQQADQAMYRNKLEQLRPLSEDELGAFHSAISHLEAAGVRPRDVPKYIQRFGATAVTHAVQMHQERVDSGQMTLM
jgi:GGDEF domain-containing protein